MTRQPILYVPIGVSGAGKSTLYETLVKDSVNLDIFSWDLLRLKWYSPDYRIAWQMYLRDSEFFNRSITVFKELVKTGHDIYIDNMNLTIGSRAQFLRATKDHHKVAYVFDIPLDELLHRHQFFRNKNKIPLTKEDIVRQLNSLEQPHESEGFQEVIHMRSP